MSQSLAIPCLSLIDSIRTFQQQTVGRKKTAKKHGAAPGFEPGTSSTRTRNHATRPRGQLTKMFEYVQENFAEIFGHVHMFSNTSRSLLWPRSKENCQVEDPNHP